MIELLKYLANNLEPHQLLEVAHIISQHPEMIDSDTFIEIVNEVNHYDMRKLDEDTLEEISLNMLTEDEKGWSLDELPSRYQNIIKRMEDIDHIRINSKVYKLLKDNNIGLN
tara:strand:- start:85 stop:420 length:336 start_codon:yes stop_codon:yes gene_type:complete